MQPFEELEQKWAEFNKLDPAGMVACASGTAALHLALEVLPIPKRGEVLVPDYTMIACARACTLAELTPVFIDCDDRLCVDKYLFEEQKNGTPHAVMPVAVYGRKVSEDVFYHADQYNLYVIEDLAEAHGVRPNKVTDAACWSFYRNKIVCCPDGEGGAVWFKKPAHANVARELRSLGFTAAHDYTHTPRGHNYRLSNPHAVGILQNLNWYKLHRNRRLESVYNYDRVCPEKWRMSERDAPWVYDVRVPGMTRARMGAAVRALNAAGVGARMGFYPMSMQEEYRDSTLFYDKVAPRSYAAAAEVFYLPVLTEGGFPVDQQGAKDVFGVLCRPDVLGDLV